MGSIVVALFIVRAKDVSRGSCKPAIHLTGLFVTYTNFQWTRRSSAEDRKHQGSVPPARAHGGQEAPSRPPGGEPARRRRSGLRAEGRGQQHGRDAGGTHERESRGRCAEPRWPPRRRAHAGCTAALQAERRMRMDGQAECTAADTAARPARWCVGGRRGTGEGHARTGPVREPRARTRALRSGAGTGHARSSPPGSPPDGWRAAPPGSEGRTGRGGSHRGRPGRWPR